MRLGDEKLAILEKEIWLTINGRTAKHYEDLGYEMPRYKDKSGRIRVKKGTAILVKISHLPENSNQKVTKVCDDCGKKTPNKPYNQIKIERKKGDGKDRCKRCGNKRNEEIKKLNIDYKKSLEYWAKNNNKEYLLLEFSDKNAKRPCGISYGTSDEYLWNCSDCKSEYDMRINDRTCGNQNCPYCSGQRVSESNCLNTTHPEAAKLLFNQEDGYKYTAGSNKKVDWKCLDCGNKIKNKTIYHVTNQGLLSCPKCSDGVKYTEKFMYNVLCQLAIEFEFQMSFDWSNNKRYDFYIHPNIIIEVHGEQHYRYTGFGRTLNEEQENDKLKEKLARENGIENYIVIDCRKSEMKYIKDNILKSKLSTLMNLTNVNWLECHKYACESLVKVVSELWDKYKNVVKIGTELKLEQSTVRKYLKRGTELNWCNYEPREKNAKPIVRLSLQGEYIDEFESAKEAERALGVNSKCIYQHLRGKIKTAGGFKWMYSNEYKLNN